MTIYTEIYSLLPLTKHQQASTIGCYRRTFGTGAGVAIGVDEITDGSGIGSGRPVADGAVPSTPLRRADALPHQLDTNPPPPPTPPQCSGARSQTSSTHRTA